MSLTEDDELVTLVVVDEGAVVIDFENAAPPTVRVNGFTQRASCIPEILAFMEREAEFFPGGRSGALDAYIVSMEKQIYDRTLALRREVRKLVLVGRAIKAAKLIKRQASDP